MRYGISHKANQLRLLAAKVVGFSAVALCFVTAWALAEVPANAPPLPEVEPIPGKPPLSGTLYVSDELKTALRTGPTTNHRISSFLPSGTPLSVKSSNDEWVEVDVIGTNRTGWISRLSVQKSIGAKALLVKRDATILTLRSQLEELKTALAELKQSQQDTSKNLGETTEKFDRLNREYEELQTLSKNAIKNHQKMQDTQQEMATIKTQYNELEIAHELLRQDNYNRGLMHGLGAVLFGIFITLVIPRLKSKPRSNRW